MDGEAIYSCLALAVECQGRAITTIEGLTQGDALDPIQQAFIAHDALQCGFCTPGQVLAMKALLDRNPHPDDEEIDARHVRQSLPLWRVSKDSRRCAAPCARQET